MVNLLTKTCDFQRLFTFNKSCPVMCSLEYPPTPADSLRLECIFHPGQFHPFHFSHAEILFEIKILLQNIGINAGIFAHWRNLTAFQSKRLPLYIGHITDFPLTWDIIQVASIFLFLGPVLTGILKSLISSYENRWAGLNCCPLC